MRVNDFRQDRDSFPTLKLGRVAGGGPKYVQRPPGTKLHRVYACTQRRLQRREERGLHPFNVFSGF
jgi:hypothetical protein